MCKDIIISDKCKIKKGSKSSGPLDTLAQLATNRENEDFDKLASTDKSDRKSLLKRARRKYMTGMYIPALVDASKQNENSTLEKSYWNTYHCSSTLTYDSRGKITGSYCKNRWCLVCNSIRTAQMMNKSKSELEAWKDKYFVTLTIPNVEAKDLSESLKVKYDLFTKIRKRITKQYERGQGAKFVGLRKLEVTYNPDRNDFHPHFHVIVDCKETAEKLCEYWLSSYNDSFYSAIWGEADPKAQDVRKADDKSTMELFKYFTKMITKPGADGKRHIYADAMDVIFNAVKGRRVFQNFGFNWPTEEVKEEEVTEEEVFAIMEYTWQKNDWEADQLVVDEETGEVLDDKEHLTGYKPAEKLEELRESIHVRKNHNWSRYKRSENKLRADFDNTVVDRSARIPVSVRQEQRRRLFRQEIDEGSRELQLKLTV